MFGRVAILGWLVAVTALGTAPVGAADRVALVIGNGKYGHATALPNPGNDAREVAKALTEIGFDVSEGRDLDRGSMERLLRDFMRKASSARVALLFFAGHGMQIDGRNYLIPIDAKLESPSDLSFETIDLDKILENFNDPNRAYIVMLDACRDNPLARSFASRLGTTRSAAVGTGLAAYSTLGTGTLIAFATAPGKVALDGSGTNSPFTIGLIKHLRTPGLEVRQLLTRVRRDVAAATNNRQIPWDNSSLLGDVYLTAMPKGWIGVRIQAVTDNIAEGLGLKHTRGALIADVDDKGPARLAGIERGSVVVEFDGKEIKELRDLPRMVADAPVGKNVEVVIVQKGKDERKTIRVGRLEESKAQPTAARVTTPPDKDTVVKKALGLDLADLNDALRKHYNIKNTVKGIVITAVDQGSAAAEMKLVGGDVIVEAAQESFNIGGFQPKLDQLKRDGRKSVVLLVANPEGQMRFVTLALQ